MTDAPTPGEQMHALMPGLVAALAAEGHGAFEATPRNDVILLSRAADGLTVQLRPDHSFVAGTAKPWRLSATIIWPKDPAGSWIEPASLGVRMRPASFDPARPAAALARDLGARVIRPAAAALPAFHREIARRQADHGVMVALADRLSRLAGGVPIHGTGRSDRLIVLHGQGGGTDRAASAEVRIGLGGSVEARVSLGAAHAEALMTCLAAICAAPADDRQAALDLAAQPKPEAA